MKLFTATASLLLFSILAQADIISCSFTEPWVTTSYSMTQSTLTYTPSEGQPTVIKNVSFQIKGPGLFVLNDKNGKTIQKLELDKKGSDGMSDQVFPYSVHDYSMTHFADGGVGGCISNFLKATGPK